MKSLLFTFAAAMLLASCNGRTTPDTASQVDTTAVAVAVPDIECMWYIGNVVVNDTLYACPAEITPDVSQSFTFADGSFGVNTNCNTLGGEYTLRGDSITFSNIMTTEMACDNEEVERLLKRVLPEVTTVDCINDSIIRLNTGSSAYIVLKRAPECDRMHD